MADLTPWSTPFTPDATAASSFDVNENCFGAQFNPSFAAGTTNNQAGEASPFTLSFGRSDADEFLNGLQMKLPQGLLGVLSKVSLCGEPQAAEGTCGAESLIGHVTVETGPGADPFVVNGGQVFITGPYKGAPYGLSIVVPAKAGPYTLAGTTGKGTVVVRAAINVDPTTSALTITADPLPTILDGIPLQLRQVNVSIDRPGFTFNPTDCNKLAIGGTLTSTQAASVSVSSPLQVTNCGALKFQPKFTVSTSGKTSQGGRGEPRRAADLPAELRGGEYRTGEGRTPQTAAVAAKTDVAGSMQGGRLRSEPSELPDGVGGRDREGVHADPEVLAVGPGVFRLPWWGSVPVADHGAPGRRRPRGLGRLDVHLQCGVTSTTLKTVPDVPVSSFELYLPEGPDLRVDDGWGVVQEPPGDADHVHRAGRRGNSRERQDRGHRLREDEEEGEGEGEQGAQGRQAAGAKVKPRPGEEVMRGVRRLATAGVVLLGALAFGAAPALAGGEEYGFTGSFGSEGSAPGQFKEPSDVAVGTASKDVYVLDKGNSRVEWFDSTGGKFEGQFNGSGTFANEKGKTAPVALSGPGAIAVDNSGKTVGEDPAVGDVYVADNAHNVVDRFSATGEYEGQLAGTCENPGESAVEPGACPGSVSKKSSRSGGCWASPLTPRGMFGCIRESRTSMS